MDPYIKAILKRFMKETLMLKDYENQNNISRLSTENFFSAMSGSLKAQSVYSYSSMDSEKCTL